MNDIDDKYCEHIQLFEKTQEVFAQPETTSVSVNVVKLLSMLVEKVLRKKKLMNLKYVKLKASALS